MMAPTPGPIPGTLGQVVGEPQDSLGFMMAPRKSMTVSTKGLLNMPGQNNCFLNSAVQVLWHLDTFRRNFRDLTGHACMAESCIFCALKELFTQFQYSQESALPPDALRHALAKTFCDQRRFQLGFMDDAAECFENILLRIHVHIANQESEDMCSNANCIPHQKFAMTLVEQKICHACGARSDPLPFTQMVHYVTTSALCAKAMEKQDKDLNSRTSASFGNFLRLAGDMGEVRECPSMCGAKVQVKKTLMNHPEVVSIGLVWDSESPTLQHITDVFHSIGMFLQLHDMFHYVYDVEWASNTTHQLVGVVTYYGKHYSTFFFHTKLKIWIYFDDATVREIGPSWEQVVEKCQRGRFQPLLLLFANPESTIDSGHPMHFANRLNDVKKSIPYINQRQAVINQYLKFQNSFHNMNSKLDYGPMRNVHVHNLPHESYLNNAYRNSDQGLPIYQNTSHLNGTLAYNQGSPIEVTNSNQPPVYSNLQYLNTLQHKDHVDISKLNEVSLPVVTQLPTLKSYDTVNASEILVEKKDFDAAKDSDSAYTEEDPEVNDMYISRKTVENVLNQQKRQMSLCRSYSQSSVGNRNSSSSLESFDNMQPVKLNPIKNILPENIPNRRDSGSWSSDRNSCSSNNSVESPFLTVMASKRLLFGLNKKNPLPDFPNSNTSDHGYDSYSVSSSDSFPSVNGSPVKLDPRLTQIPEDWQPEEHTDLDKKLKLVTEDTNGPPDCDKLCAEADLLLAKSHEKEKDGDLVMAALLCDSAAARARAAMEAPYNNSRSLVSAKMKHSTCVLRSSNLYRRLKDHEVDERRKQKGHTGHHSRQSSRDSTHSKHSRQSSKDSTHSKAGGKDNSHHSDDTENFGKNIEIYGTLPKKGSRKKNAGSLKVKDDQVYKDFLDKQRKNTSLAESLNETKMKNVDISHTQAESNAKCKSPVNTDKSHRKSYTEGIPPKSPTRKKIDTPPKSTDSEGKKKTPKPQPVEPSYQNLFSANKSNGVEFSHRDLLSPISSPDKKQHKIKRKLMGGFMKRKNRSLPDLREDQDLTDRVDCFLDDAIIQVPSMLLPNGKTKKMDKQTDSSIGSFTRGFHQPHHAFVKKDLTQRPLLMKVNPPNIQSPLLTSPKSKLVHTLPSIPKKLQDSNAKSDPCPSVISKPSKIPFMSTLPKCEPPTLPPLSPPRSLETKLTMKSVFVNKTSAIPVLTPQVPLSPLKSPNIMKDDPVLEIKRISTLEDQSADKEDLPQPSNPFLAEIQAKRKQVLNRAMQKEENSELTKSIHPIINMSESKEFSMLPKLARGAEGTSWLKELQNKQQQILNKQDTSKGFSKPTNIYDTDPSKSSIIAEIIEGPKEPDVVNGSSWNSRSWKLSAENSEPSRDCSSRTEVNSVNKTSNSVNKPLGSANKPPSSVSKTSSSVKDIASRFEKVLKMPQSIQQPVTSNAIGEQGTPSCNTNVIPVEVNESFCKMPTQLRETDSMQETIPTFKTSTNNIPLKSALKAWTCNNINNDVVHIEHQGNNIPDCAGLPEKTIVKPILKQDVLTNSFDSVTPELASTNITMQRPMQPPDYATAMQRLEFIRTSISEANVPLEPMQKPDSPKKKQGIKKTVTFSDEVVLVACAEYDEIDFSSNPLFERVYQQHVESGKGEIPILSSSYNAHAFGRNVSEDDINVCNLPSTGKSSPCNLCHNKQVSQPNTYCTDCEFYLSRFKP